MEILVKRENWDEGIWMDLPVTEEAAKEVYERLKDAHPSVFIPFIGDVAEIGLITGLARCLRGEVIFAEGYLKMFNSLAEKIDSWGEGEQILFNAALEMEQPDTIERVMEVVSHLDEYECKNDIKNMYQLGLYKMEEMKLCLPIDLKNYFDYEHFGWLNQTSNEIISDYGLIQRREVKPDTVQNKTPDTVQYGSIIFEIRIPLNANHYEKYELELPLKESDLKERGNRLGLGNLADKIEYAVFSKIPHLAACLPPRSTVGDLNQVAWAIWDLAGQTEISQEKLLAILEAEAPRTIDRTCEVIREYNNYEILSNDIKTPEDYAHYILNLNHVEIPKKLKSCVRFQDYGLKLLNGATLYQTSYGAVIRLDLQHEPDRELRVFRLYNSLALAGYWYDRESSLPEMLTGEESLDYKKIVEQKIAESLSVCDSRGLAEYLYNEVLKRRVASMIPAVTEFAGELWGMLTVYTYGELMHREKEALKVEWQEMAEFGWGGQLIESPIQLERGELYVGFWDRDNNENLFIKTEEEFRCGFQSASGPGEVRLV
ncbi:DUF6329 domain-containing protein [Hungatella effluvii]|uniref:DUF6329 domain-containing protein n=1 Tax=Hungatella effluvii TaxID=1096246 RepID=UPI0022E50A59|nr:DUF6329 domain-containing protein [Hungatella effluvii]